MQLDSKLVDRQLIDLILGEGDLDLDRDSFAESLSFGSSEDQVDGVDLVRIGFDVGKSLQEDGSPVVGLALDILLDGNVDDLNGYIVGLLLSKGE